MTPIARSKPTARSAAIGCIVGGTAPDRLRAVLGSGVGIIVYDPQRKAGALAHCLLPEGTEGDAPPAKFVKGALLPLIECAAESGARRDHVIVKLAGGAAMFTGSARGQGLGQRNLSVARHEIAAQGLKLSAENTGGEKGRVLELDLTTGNVLVKSNGEEPIEI